MCTLCSFADRDSWRQEMIPREHCCSLSQLSPTQAPAPGCNAGPNKLGCSYIKMHMAG